MDEIEIIIEPVVTNVVIELQEQAPGGGTGQDGASAYELAVANGFVGTELEWLASLQGEDGADGAQGIQGEQGEQGEQGIQGIPGNDGSDGADGLSAYEIAVNNGFVGTEAEWLASLQGEDGADGTSSTTVGEPDGSAVILNMVSISQANYDAAVIADEIVDTTLYIITDAETRFKYSWIKKPCLFWRYVGV